MTDPRYHSVAAIVPFLVAATLLGIARLTAHRRPLAAGAVLACCLVVTLAIGPWARLVGLQALGARDVTPPPRAAALADAVALVPDAVPVTASNSVGAHLSARAVIYSVPLLGGAEWVVVDRDDPWVVTPDSPILTSDPERVSAFVARLQADPLWETILDRDGAVVLRRVAG